MYRFIDHTLRPNFELEKMYNQELKNCDNGIPYFTTFE